MKTVKELSEEMGISKQALLKKINNLPINQQPTKFHGKYMIGEELESKLKAYKKGKLRGEFVQEPIENNQTTTNQQPINNYIVDILKEQIEYLKKQIDAKDDQIDKIQKLLENQQVLNLKSNESLVTLKNRERKIDKIVGRLFFWRDK